MNRNNLVIWKRETDLDYNNEGFDKVYLPEEIEEVVDLVNCYVLHTGLYAPEYDEDELTKKFNETYPKYVGDCFIEEKLAEFLKDFGVSNGRHSCSDYETPTREIVYDCYNHIFAPLDTYPTVKSVTFWDGHNWKREVLDEGTQEINVLVDEDLKQSLDQWNGSNHITGGVGNHEEIYKVMEVDGESVEDTYLIYCWSQWQGVMPTAKVVSRSGLINYLVTIGKDPEEYLDSLCAVL